MQDYIVTVYCTAFNHGKYIRKTLEGFVTQKTTFPFRVIVHDDASTDDTRAIIEEYAQKYPDLIYPILQEENQYSQRVDIYKTFVMPLIQSKYTALCEGDDYWCDPDKLQLQIDYMQQHPNCSLCVHNTELIYESGESKGILMNNDQDKPLTTEQIIEAGGGSLFHTSSFVFKTEIRNQKPKEFSINRVGDYPLAMYLAMHGDVYYIGRVMSRYRIGSTGSWVKKVSSNKELLAAQTERELQDLDRIDALSEHKYHESFLIAKKRSQYRTYLKFGKLGKIFRDPVMRGFFRENTFLQKCKILVKAILRR